jgi:peptidoglycan/LPS O-acetylase OafA/YrhL
LPPPIGPTWSLAIEEQYYFLWAPVVRLLRRPSALAGLLAIALISAPLFRLSHLRWITPTHTLTHIDGIAMGSLLALGLHTLPLSRRSWRCVGLGVGDGGIIGCRSISAARRFSIPR